MIKQLIEKFVIKDIKCVPESKMDEIREMYSSLPERPQRGKVAPEWKKQNKTAGASGGNTS